MSTQDNIPAYVEVNCSMVQVHDAPGYNAEGHRKIQSVVREAFAHEPGFAGIQGIENATLVRYRSPTSPGKYNTQLQRIVQIPLYFEEIQPFRQIDPEDIERRLALARLTGYVLFGRDECLAILHGTEGGFTFTACFEVNTHGVARSIAGYYEHNVDTRSKPQRIAALNITETQSALAETQGNVYWWGPQRLAFNKDQMDRSLRTIALLREHLAVAPPERTASGSIITRSFIANGNTGSVAHMRPRAEGWVTYPTSQDAWYYGVWVNPRKRETLTYAEQDVFHTVSETEEQFRDELKAMAESNGQRREPCAIGYSPDRETALFDSLFFLEGDLKVIRFNENKPAKNEKGSWNAPLFGALRLDAPSVLALKPGGFEPLPREAFELDLLNPLAFTGWRIEARLTRQGYDLRLHLEDGRSLAAKVQLQPVEA